MNFKWHAITSIIAFTALTIIVEGISFGLSLLAMCLALVPDFDLKLDKEVDKLANLIHHRWAPLHSIFLPLIAWLTEFSLITALACFAFGLHCVCDITWNPKKWIGTYTVKFTKHFGLNGVQSTVWFLANFVVGSIILYYSAQGATLIKHM